MGNLAEEGDYSLELIIDRYSFYFIANLDIIYDIHTAGDNSEICILSIQPGSIGFGNKELRVIINLRIASACNTD